MKKNDMDMFISILCFIFKALSDMVKKDVVCQLLLKETAFLWVERDEKTLVAIK